MKNKLRLLLMVIFFIIAGVIARPFFAMSENAGGNKEEIDELNDEIAEKREKVKQLEKSIEEYKDKIAAKRVEGVSLSNQLSIIDNHLIQVELDIEATEAKVETLALEIEALQLLIEDKGVAIDRQEIILKELIRTLHYENQKKYIEIMAAYNSFSEFYNRVQYLDKIENDLGKTTKTIRLAKADLEVKNEQTQNRKDTYEELNEELENKRKDLEEQGLHKETLLAETHASELTFKAMVNNLKKQYQQIENEISSIEQQVRQKLESQDKLSDIEDDSLVLSWPTQSRYITAYFHDPDYPYRHVFEHSGIDIRAAQGTPLHAASSGYVARARYCSTPDCFAYVLIVHSNGISTLYGHMSKITVQADQFVTRGDIIGYSGAAPGTIGAGPFTTGPHLHFEVRKDGIPVNALGYLIRDWD